MKNLMTPRKLALAGVSLVSAGAAAASQGYYLAGGLCSLAGGILAVPIILAMWGAEKPAGRE